MLSRSTTRSCNLSFVTIDLMTFIRRGKICVAVQRGSFHLRSGLMKYLLVFPMLPRVVPAGNTNKLKKESDNCPYAHVDLCCVQTISPTAASVPVTHFFLYLPKRREKISVFSRRNVRALRAVRRRTTFL